MLPHGSLPAATSASAIGLALFRTGCGIVDGDTRQSSELGAPARNGALHDLGELVAAIARPHFPRVRHAAHVSLHKAERRRYAMQPGGSRTARSQVFEGAALAAEAMACRLTITRPTELCVSIGVREGITRARCTTQPEEKSMSSRPQRS